MKAACHVRSPCLFLILLHSNAFECHRKVRFWPSHAQVADLATYVSKAGSGRRILSLSCYRQAPRCLD